MRMIDDDIKPCEDAISRAWVKENMLKFGFLAPDMTVTEFVEDAPPVAPSRPKGLDELIEGFAKALTYEDVITAEAEAKGYAQGFKDGMESGSQDDEFKNFDRGDLIALIEAKEERIGELLADRPQEWIPCSERAPEENGESYLTYQGSAKYGFCQVLYYDDGWNCYHGEKENEINGVVAWMPLPEPYKDGE